MALLVTCALLLPCMAVAQRTAGCADGQKGSCGACGICCCYKGPLRYVPDESSCSCKISYGDSFVVMVTTAVLTILVGFVGGYYFGGGWSRLSPFREYAPEDDDTHQFQ